MAESGDPYENSDQNDPRSDPPEPSAPSYGEAPPPPPPPPPAPEQAAYGQPAPPPPAGYGPGSGQPAPYQQPGQPAQPGQAGPLTADERTWGGAAHWSALVASLVGLSFLGPLIVMLTKGNESGYVRAQAVESLNFQLSMLIYFIVSFVLVFVLIGFLLLPVVGIAWLVLTILASVKSANGELYRYPLTIRMVS